MAVPPSLQETTLPLVSIIIPGRNCARTLATTLASCFAQDWPALEIIYVDNGSNDDSMEIARSLAATRPQTLTLISHPEAGANRARQAGFLHARGDYIRWLDADDQLAHDATRKQAQALEARPGFDIAYCDWVWRRHVGHCPSPQELAQMPASHGAVAYGDRCWRQGESDPTHAEASFKLTQEDDFLTRLLEDKWIPPHAYLLRRDAARRLIDLQAFHPDRKVAQDREFFTFAALAGFRFLHVSGTRVFYNAWSSEQITRRISPAQRGEELTDCFARLRNFAASRPELRLSRNQRMLLELPRGQYGLAAGIGMAVHVAPGRFRVDRQGGTTAWLGSDEARIYQTLFKVRTPAAIEALAKAIQHVEPTLWERHSEVVRTLLRLHDLGLLLAMPTASEFANTLLPNANGRAPRLLLVTDVPFWLEGRGDSARIREMVKFLAGEVALDLFVIAHNPVQPAKLSRVALPIGQVQYPAWHASFADPRMLPAMLAKVAELAPFDVCLFEYLRLAELRAALPSRVKTLLDTHDLISARAASFRQFGYPPPREMTPDAEYAAFRQFDAVVLIQADDYTSVAAQIGRERCILAPHPVTMPRATVRPHAQQICFIASEALPNVDGLRWFLTEVWQTLAVPAHLHIFGRVGGKVDVPAHGNISVHGKVDDLAAVYQATDLVINPVRFGAGLKIKTVEAIASGLPLVTSREGARGLTDHADKAFLMAEDAASFRIHLERLLLDQETRTHLAESAWRLGQDQFTPTACFQSLLERIRQ